MLQSCKFLQDPLEVLRQRPGLCGITFAWLHETCDSLAQPLRCAVRSKCGRKQLLGHFGERRLVAQLRNQEAATLRRRVQMTFRLLPWQAAGQENSTAAATGGRLKGLAASIEAAERCAQDFASNSCNTMSPAMCRCLESLCWLAA